MAERIRVTTEELLEKKEECKLLLKQITEEFITVGESLEEVKSCFVSGAVLVFQKQYQKRQEKVRVALESMTEYVDKLEEIAAVYNETERSNTV